jgi:hypothetical protein
VLLQVVRHAGWILLFSVPAVILWWHVWSGHPSSTLTCACGDPAQEVWFIAWPAWALSHFSNLFVSNRVNVPFGANLLSNTSGTLVGVMLSPVTWLWGPVVATNVALTLAPGLSAWGCWLALRRHLEWKPAALPAAFIFGYSPAIVDSLIFGHVSVAILVLPPLLLALLYETLVIQTRSPWLDGAFLAAAVVAQFLISPEDLVMTALLAGIGIAFASVAGWRHVARRVPHALRALALGGGISVLFIAYPSWYGLHGPESVSGVLFAIAPLAGVQAGGFFSPGPYGMFANAYIRFGGYFGRIGPPADYLGWGLGVSSVLSVLAARRALAWLLIVLAVATSWIGLGSYVISGPDWLRHIWLPWRSLAKLPVFKEILPDQFSPFITLFLALLVAVGLNAAYQWLRSRPNLSAKRVQWLAGLLVVVVGVGALVPVFITFDMPYTVRSTSIPTWVSADAPKLPDQSVVLTIPFAESGSTVPMLWQSVDDMHFELAGAALKTPNATGGPVNQGLPGSARRLLYGLSVLGAIQPKGDALQYAAVRYALRRWRVTEVVIDGVSQDPVYASGFMAAAIGSLPKMVDSAWVWKLSSHGPRSPAVTNTSLIFCRKDNLGTGPDHRPLAMARCVLQNTEQAH